MLGQAVSARAIEPQDILAPIVGPVVSLPHVSLSESYDDNVLLLSDEQGKIDDLVTTLSPGIGLQFGENILDSNYIGLDYTMGQQWYAENNELNSDSHALTFGINYLKEGKFTFTGGDMIRLDNTLLKGRERSFFTDLVEGSPETRSILIKRKTFNDQYRFEYTISPNTSVYAATSTAVSFMAFRWSKLTWKEWGSDQTPIFSAGIFPLWVIFQRNLRARYRWAIRLANLIVSLMDREGVLTVCPFLRQKWTTISPRKERPHSPTGARAMFRLRARIPQ